MATLLLGGLLLVVAVLLCFVLYRFKVIAKEFHAAVGSSPSPRSQHIPPEADSSRHCHSSQELDPTANASPSSSAAHRFAKEPPVFDGENSQFREWTFAIELAFRSLNFTEPSKMVDYATGYLTGNARLWFISSMDAGVTFQTWQELKEALRLVYGPVFDQERIRMDLFAIQQTGKVSAYISDFSRLSLQAPELDELSRAVLFVKGLRGDLKHQVLQSHPQTLDEAFRSAQTAEQLLRVSQIPRSTFQSQSRPKQKEKLGKLTDEEREKLRHTGSCFACRKPGHLAKDCTRYPNDGRQ